MPITTSIKISELPLIAGGLTTDDYIPIVDSASKVTKRVSLDSLQPVFLNGTSSWATNSISASYVSGSNVVGKVVSASYSLSSSYAENVDGLWQKNGSDIYFTAGKTGIGVSAPTTTLDIDGSVNVSGSNLSGSLILNSGNDSTAPLGYKQIVLNFNTGFPYSNYISTRHGSNNAIDFYTNGDVLNVSMVDGNVGIGTTSSINNRLTVLGSISASSVTGSVSGTASWAMNVVNGGAGNYPSITDTLSRIGINNTSPKAALDVNGSILLSGYIINTGSAAPYSNFIGAYAGYITPFATDSNFIGRSAGYMATRASSSNFFGVVAGYSATYAYHSNFFGYSAGGYSTSASYSNFIGYEAGIYATSASNSNFIGYKAGDGAVTANNSIFIGYQAGGNSDAVDNTGGKSSILIGDYTSTDGNSDSIAIGKGTRNTTNNQLNIGNVLYATNIHSSSVTSGTPQSDGKVGIGVNLPDKQLHVIGDILLTGYLVNTGSAPAASNFIGVNAGKYASLAIYSNFIGIGTGNVATSASNSNFIGHDAGSGASKASNSNFIGVSTGINATNASGSNFFGANAGYLATNAYNSNFMGSGSGYSATSANNSNFIGTNSGKSATVAYNSNFIGVNTGKDATSAYTSNFMGYLSGEGAISANDSNFIGNRAGYFATNANYSNFIGYQAGWVATYANRSNFIGPESGYNATNASNSNFFGYRAGRSATDSNDSNFIGYSAGYTATSAAYSNFIGHSAGNAATNAYNSNFLGNNVGYGATNAIYSNFIGDHTGYGAINSTYSNFIGVNAGYSASNAASSNFIGSGSGYYATNANNSNFVGHQAGNNASEAHTSNFIGNIAGDNATNADNSNFIGSGAGGTATNANNSNFIGTGAGYSASNAASSNFVGYFAGLGALAAKNSIFIGYSAGVNDIVDNTIGTNYSSILLGNYTSTDGFSNGIAIGQGTANTIDHQLNIGNVLYATGIYSGISPTGTPQLNGKVGIGVNNPVNALDVAGTISCSVISASAYYGAVISSTTINGATINSSTIGNTVSSSANFTTVSASFYYGTSSWANNVVSASYLSGAYATVTNFNATNNSILNNVSVGGTLNAVNITVTGNLNATSSYAKTASYVSASNIDGVVLSASYAKTSSYLNYPNNSTASYAITASYAMNGGGGGSLTPGATYPITSSWANNVVSASYLSGAKAIVNDLTTVSGARIGGMSLNVPTQTSVQVGYGINTNNDCLNSVQIGYQAGSTSAFSPNIVQVGYQAGYNSTYVTSAIQIGYQAGYNSTYATSAIQIGYQAGYSSTVSQHATQIGYQAGYNSTDSRYSTQIGSDAGYNSTYATYAVQIGNAAGGNADTADYAVQIGSYAGNSSNISQYAVQIGYQAGQFSTNAGDAVQIGYNAGQNATTATNAVHIGYQAGQQAVSGANTIFIGANADTLNSRLYVTKSVAIGYNAKVSGSNMCVIGGIAGGADALKVGIGTTKPTYTLEVVGNISSSALLAKTINTYDLISQNITLNGLVTEKALQCNEFGQIESSEVSNGELNMLLGVTSAIQDQLNTKYYSGSSMTASGIFSNKPINASSFTGSLFGTATSTISASYLSGSTAIVNTLTASNGAQIGGMSNNTPNSESVQIGYGMGSDSYDRTKTVRIGYQAGYASISASNSVQIGYQAGLNSTSASNSVQIGYNVGYATAINVTGAVQIGSHAGFDSRNSNGSVQIGLQAGALSLNSTETVQVGYMTGYNASSASYSTFIGARADTSGAGQNISKSIAIGYNAKVNGSNMAVIGGTGTDAVNVGIGTFNPVNTLEVVGNVKADSFTGSFSGSATNIINIWGWDGSVNRYYNYVYSNSKYVQIATVTVASGAVILDGLFSAVISGSLNGGSPPGPDNYGKGSGRNNSVTGAIFIYKQTVGNRVTVPMYNIGNGGEITGVYEYDGEGTVYILASASVEATEVASISAAWLGTVTYLALPT